MYIYWKFRIPVHYFPINLHVMHFAILFTPLDRSKICAIETKGIP